ncbi:hypothetical protein BDV98DRAFT_585867 [Pterulicium gracile]|uniref:Uncharacterized protein n=1 Tax=Pterulicium gracile TaxID=1884261 RepID=A0A5C3Q4L1_9AGAR|nr:hypothetical protein BDV98DRAFT_585867 [Pterula gracilis]
MYQWKSNETTVSSALYARSSEPSTSTGTGLIGPILGGAIGGIIFLVLVAALFMTCCNDNRQSSSVDKLAESDSKAPVVKNLQRAQDLQPTTVTPYLKSYYNRQLSNSALSLEGETLQYRIAQNPHFPVPYVKTYGAPTGPDEHTVPQRPGLTAPIENFSPERPTRSASSSPQHELEAEPEPHQPDQRSKHPLDESD